MGSGGAFRAVLRDRTLRRLQCAVLGSVLGRFAFIVALAVWAYEEGGAGLVGLVGFLRLAPGALVAPFAATYVDRHPRDRVMLVSDLTRAVACVAIAGAVASDAPVAVTVALVMLVAVFAAPFEPARAALTPALVERPALLTAANAVSSAINSSAYFLGPALGGLLLAVSSVEVVFLGTAAACLVSVAFILGLHAPRQELGGGTGEGLRGMVADVQGGLRLVRDDSGIRVLFAVLGLQTVIAGAVGVFVVVIAIDALGAGQAWVGYLNGFLGVGALAGVAVVARLLAGERRLSTGTLVGLALWGLPFLLVAVWDTRVAAVLAMVLAGIGDTAVDVSGITLLQRVVPEALLGRVFGLLEALVVGGLAVGALLAPLAVSLLGLDGALVLFGLLPLLALGGVRAMRGLDARAAVDERPRALLRGLEIFAVLPLPTLDGLAGALRPVEVPEGAAVFHQGDPGDRYYVIDEGEVEVRVDGAGRRTLGPGEGFGEIALLRDVARTATVVATEPVKLLALDRDHFLPAVTSHAGSALTAEAVVSRYASRRAAAVPA